MPWVDVDNFADFDLSEEEEKALEEEEKRKKKLRFYIDADVPDQVTQILRERKFNVLTAQEAGRRTHSDETHLAEAQKQIRILVTCDTDYLNERRFPINKCSTLIVCDFGTGSREQIIDTFDCLSTIEWAPQLFTRWMKIHAKPSYWTETKDIKKDILSAADLDFNKVKRK